MFGRLRAGVAQLVEYKLPKLGVASSSLVARSKNVWMSITSAFDDVRKPELFQKISRGVRKPNGQNDSPKILGDSHGLEQKKETGRIACCG